MGKKSVFYICLALCGCCLPGMAQEKRACAFPEPGTFVVQGKAVNVPEGEKGFRLAVCGPFENRGYEVPFREDGTFRKVIPIPGTQDVYLYLGDVVAVFSYPGDTLRLTFDYKNCPASIRLSGPTVGRTKEHELSLELHRKFRGKMLNLQRTSWGMGMGTKRTSADSLMLARIREYVTEYRATVRAFVAANGAIPHEDLLLHRAYFTGLLWIADRPDLLSELLHFPALLCFDGEKQEQRVLYQDPDFNPFQSSDALTFMRFYFPPKIERALDVWGYEDECGRFLRKMRAAQGLVPNRSLREWYLADEFGRMAGHIRPEKRKAAEAAGEALLATVEEPLIRKHVKETMEHYFGTMGQGQPAPDFKLRDEKGETVSLSDLKGKIVYLDFWSEGCGPCVQEFTMQEALHKKYEAYDEQIAYVYICVGSTENRWKELLGVYGLKGILLHAGSDEEGGIMSYRPDSFPLYVLIDKEGRIVEYNTLRPSELVDSRFNVLDALLRKGTR